MYGLNENNGLEAQCQTIFCQEHHGNRKGSGVMWPKGQALRRSGFDVFHTRRALNQGASQGPASWCMHTLLSSRLSTLVTTAVSVASSIISHERRGIFSQSFEFLDKEFIVKTKQSKKPKQY
jgi:hypothetical protein